jgi:hypothetical protein
MVSPNDDRQSRLRDFVGKVRPQIAGSILILGIIAYLGVVSKMNEVSTMCVAGIIALAKDVLQSDA